MIDGKGPKGALRREACLAGCPTIIMEGGEVWKVEPTIIATAIRGIKNVLTRLEMIEGKTSADGHQVVVKKTKWIRAERGGFLQFHVKPGDVLEKDQPLATNTTLLGRERSVLYAPFDSVVVGMTTLPAVSPGEPVCHLCRLPKGLKPSAWRKRRDEDHGLGERVLEELATNVHVTRPT